jgi:hypothetical protein
MVETAFRRCGALVRPLLQHSSMTGTDATAVLGQAARIYDIEAQMAELNRQRDEE